VHAQQEAFLLIAAVEHHTTKCKSENKEQCTPCVDKNCSYVASNFFCPVKRIISTARLLVKAAFPKKNQILIVLCLSFGIFVDIMDIMANSAHQEIRKAEAFDLDQGVALRVPL